MLSDINEKYLLKYISSRDDEKEGELFNVLKNFGIKINFQTTESVWEIIDTLELGGLFNE